MAHLFICPNCGKRSTETDRTQVFMNNCYADYAQRNATTLIELLGED